MLHDSVLYKLTIDIDIDFQHNKTISCLCPHGMKLKDRRTCFCL